MHRKKFYKFQPINKYSISALAQRKMWCPKASFLNDPFDFKCVNITPEDINALSNSKQKIEFSSSFYKINEQELNNFKKMIQEKVNDWGVMSFTEKNDNLLMWAHYADMHQGMCLEFLVEDDVKLEAGSLRVVQPLNGPKWKGGIHKVSYSKSLPILDFSSGLWHTNGLMKIFLTKSADWKYEKEWRCIIEKGGNLRSYIGILSRIIFGCKTPEQDKVIIKSILKDEVKYSESALSDSEFKVKILSDV